MTHKDEATPGPWHTVRYGMTDGVAIADKNGLLALCYARVGDTANARLIAAAPALRDALRNLMWRFDDADEDAHSHEETAPDILAARAALALLEP